VNLIELSRHAVDMHCHGIGRFDFTEIPDLELQEIEDILTERHHFSILTLYLPYHNLNEFVNIVEVFHKGKQAGRYQHILGLGLEGPLLASHGGTPHQGIWLPTKEEWQTLASCGKKGLLYVISSPDAAVARVSEQACLSDYPDNFNWIVNTLISGGVLPAAGHFTKENPQQSAEKLQAAYEAVAGSDIGFTLTDHLYNDMPKNFKHAWRTREEKARRDVELTALDLGSWTLDNLEEKLGPVPATMVRNARKGIVKIAMNFDGEHVDLAIVKKTVELVGAENLMMMTDSIESKRLAGRELTMHEGSSLLYQDEDVVAAGSQGILNQIKNMIDIGLTESEIQFITHDVPNLVLTKRQQYIAGQL
jgi:N-acetylglucosamine-6-phosphate deacetylase